jgi:hypothetical protein
MGFLPPLQRTMQFLRQPQVHDFKDPGGLPDWRDLANDEKQDK